MFRCLLTRTHSYRNSRSGTISSPRNIGTSAAICPKDDSFSFAQFACPPHRPLVPSEPSRDRVPHPPQSSPDVSFPANSRLHDHLVSRYCGSRCPNDAKELHLQLLKSGFDNDLFLCNTLVSIYARVGDLGSAQKLFDDMPSRNSVTWACLVSGYAQSGMPEKAWVLFRCMVREGLMPNHYVFGSVLRACQEYGPSGLRLGMQIHGMVSKTTYAGDVVVSNVLISMYGGCLGSIDDAFGVFDEINLRNSISWNSIMSVCSQRGNADLAFELFARMQRNGGSGSSLKPNEYTFGSLITATCSSSDSSSLLEQMFARVTKSGFLYDLYVGSALVSGFARLGLTDHARNIFGQMTERNVVSMNGLMVGLVRQKKGEEAFKIFSETRELVDINVDSYIVLLSAVAEFAVPDEGKRSGREIHAYLIRTGLINNKVAVENGLVTMYAKCGSVNDAKSVFALMNEKDLVSWNSLISALDQNGCFEDTVISFSMMRRSGLVPSNFTLISTLSSCASLGWIWLGWQIHGEGMKLGLDLDVSVANALLALYAEVGCLAECEKVFSFMPEYDQVSWNSIIGTFSDSEALVSGAVKYLLGMMRAGWSLNRVTFINILAAVSLLSLQRFNHQIHALALKYNLAEDIVIENALLACYGKCGEMDECEQIFSRMSERRDEVSWNAMISGYIHNEFLSKAMDMVWYMLQRGQRLDSFTFATILSACASVATLERGMEVHACGIRAHLQSDVVVGSALLDMYSKCGRVDYASRFFQNMPVRNVYSWNSMISGFARHGHGEDALNLFRQMKLSGQPPDHVTFVGVLSACSHVGLVEEGFTHFKAMQEEFGLAPRMEHYSCMVDLLGRAGELSKIEHFVNKMPMEPNILIWRTVLGACCRANGRNSELGQRAAHMLFEMEPQNAVNYVLLSNMYASGGKWDDMAKARRAMRQAAAKKDAGCSWVTMKDGVHVFVSGDRSHPEKDLIYEKLAELNRKMRDAGYVPQTSFALYDLEVENKEELLSHHSEKIAVAFVLTRKSEKPIRIMKNLRVCGDCHSAFKYISKIVGRIIVLRDSNRFHHFEDGACSCRDYW
ncbi:putative pentatricopeptide repeat-containing protein At5g09950 [Syzygium oleosum]|uniref:putative pentatricopeptide repeat-containing protein At5g09950 n=1 Tax=Syzygium oleosum TaxID=219896 RepID=UPI0024BAF4D5|nr:putative pentatricopeptide repeat-containing protein At5g09950 [Syzygium oleosum]